MVGPFLAMYLELRAMLKRFIKNVEYEIVSEFYDNGDSSAIAKTIVEEGETSVNTYRLCVGSSNTVTQVPFDKNETALHDYLLTNSELHWSDHWEDPVEDESDEKMVNSVADDYRVETATGQGDMKLFKR